jgi:Bax protein
MRTVTALLLAALTLPARAQVQDPLPPGKTFEFRNPEELKAFFVANDYTIEGWASGDRTVPRLYLAHVPERWRLHVIDSLTVQQKVQYFFFIYAPLVLKANEAVQLDRNRLQALRRGPAAERVPGSAGGDWLGALAKDYELKGDLAAPAMLQELESRVDIVPTSLALAQAAMESGWGSSHFADLGNALFGQWTWGDDGITPTNQRAGEKGNYKVKAFARPGLSVAAYLHNLNTHPAYGDLRRLRTAAREQGRPVTGHDLAAGLVKYSERGQVYVEELRSIIRHSRLEETEKATLRDMELVWLVPVGEGSK